MSQSGKYVPPSLDEPCPTVAAQNRLGIARVCFLSKQYGGDVSGKNIGIDGPAGSVTCRDHHAFITAYMGNSQVSGLDAPCPTIPTHDRIALHAIHFIDNQYGTGWPSGIDKPANTITTNPKMNLIMVKPWIMDTSFGNVGSPISEPSRVITANRKWQYLVNPQFASEGSSIEKPCFTLIARMDKKPPCIVTAESGPAVAIYEDDSPMTIKIKEFMSMYGISDIFIRMLKISELKLIMGFPSGYVLVGSKAEQKKYIGNAVEVNMSRCLCEALYKKLATA